jgi:hypothetical protein
LFGHCPGNSFIISEANGLLFRTGVRKNRFFVRSSGLRMTILSARFDKFKTLKVNEMRAGSPRSQVRHLPTTRRMVAEPVGRRREYNAGRNPQ